MADTTSTSATDRATRPPTGRSFAVAPWQARVSGALAAAVALAVGEFLSSFGGHEQSLIASVGSSFVDQFAAVLKNIAVAIFGTSDKAALVIGIVFVSMLAGAALGTATTRRAWVGPAGFAAFGAFGLYAGVADPQTNKAAVVLAAVGATAAGIATLWMLLRIAATGTAPVSTSARPTVTEHPTNPAATRRAFFGWAGAASVFAIGITAAGRAISGPSKAEAARSGVKLPSVGGTGTAAGTTTVPANAPMGVAGLSPYYVPNADFYRIDTAIVVPQVDPSTWTLKITGMVDHPYELTLDDILALPQVEEPVTLQCVSNDVGGDLVGNAKWQGVPLKAILEKAGVQAGATQIVSKSIDGWTCGFPTATGLDGRTALLAVGMNGEPLPIPHGFPARLVVAGLYGYVSATKWITEIRLTKWEDFDGYWIPRGWSKEGPIKTASRIDVPRPGASVQAGPTKIAGVAWAPSRGITKVEVQVDDGPWQTARLGEVASKNTWVQWVLEWDATSGDHSIQVRATDTTGETQTSTFAPPEPNGSTGWDRRDVHVD